MHLHSSSELDQAFLGRDMVTGYSHSARGYQKFQKNESNLPMD